MESGSLSVFERFLCILLDLFVFGGSFGIFVIHLNDQFFDGLLNLVENDWRLYKLSCLLTADQLLGWVVVLQVENVKVAIAGDVHPMEPTNSRIIEDHVGVAEMV